MRIIGIVVAVVCVALSACVSHKTKTEKWGTGIIDAISSRLQKEIPGLRGFSGKSIRKMRQFYETWGDSAIRPSATAKLEAGKMKGLTK